MNRKIYSFAIEKAVVDDDDNKIGRIIGLASTFGNVDLMGDIIAPNAFDDTLKLLKKNDQTLPVLLNHDPSKLIGGIRPSGLKITDEGLQSTTLIDLETQQGAEAFSLAKKGFLNAFSIGFDVDEFSFDTKTDLRTFEKIKLVEISLTPLPANPKATVSEVKSVKNAKSLKELKAFNETLKLQTLYYQLKEELS